MEVYESLDASLAAKTLSKDELSVAIAAISDGYECIPSSIGADWIWHHPNEFGEVVGDALAFYRAEMGKPHSRYFMRTVLLSAELLCLIPEAEREAFVREAHILYGDISRDWVRISRKAGIPDQALGDMVIALLHKTVVRQGCANPVDDFLSYARSDHGYGDCVWKMLGARLAEALRICIEKSPTVFLGQSAGLPCFFQEDVAHSMLEDAVSRIAFPCHTGVLRNLSLGVCVALARRIKVVDHSCNSGEVLAQFFLNLFADIGDGVFFEGDDGEQHLITGEMLYNEMRVVLHSAGSTNLYRVYAREKKVGNIDLPWLEAKFAKLLHSDGYLVGTIEEGEYMDRKTRSIRRQPQVRHNGKIYVHDRMQHRYFPNVGDTVYFSHKHGRVLTPTVVCVMFYPVLGK